MSPILGAIGLLGVICCVSAAVPAVKVTDTFATTMTPVRINATTLVPEMVVHRKVELLGVEATTMVAATTIGNRTTLSEYFIQIFRGDFMGARKCKKSKDCGAGLKCDMLMHWCVRQDAPAAQELGGACARHEDCSDFYHCWNSACHFSGPRPCKVSTDCMPGFPGLNWDCVDTKDLERTWIRQQLMNRTRTMVDLKPRKNSNQKKDKEHRHDDHSSELGSDELIAMGMPEGDSFTHGHRCWARCTDDKSCMNIRYPNQLFSNDTFTFGCYFNYCIRRTSFISLPNTFNATMVFNSTSF